MKLAIRELWWAIKTKKLAPGMTLFEYWIWRMHRSLDLPK
jgi:hypothetical protein